MTTTIRMETWFNEYYPDKSLKKTSFYNGKGKLKYVWDYQCKEEGMEVKKHKDTSTVCVSKEYDQDSILTTIYHTIGTDGNITKTINKRNRKGKFISYKRTKGVDDLPVSEYNLTYATDDTTLISSISYGYAKGKLISERKKSFDDEMNLTSSSFKSYKKGVLKEEIVYTFEYDTQGRPIKKVANKKNSGTQEIWNLSYSQKFASK